ncbi:hypothetical protein EXIGLDRAFT_310612 [Exidia glandulosa HHB12029]|uniref:Uncharacterized protein n=1 Tax=Exidia glandulosa HHB12029 TaxID=1314781 RepID=A0A165D079_EXIGL|nr:hypothetical protein EXIGLDRAFT_310612 [Exidia glandulosa HHB12029]
MYIAHLSVCSSLCLRRWRRSATCGNRQDRFIRCCYPRTRQRVSDTFRARCTTIDASLAIVLISAGLGAVEIVSGPSRSPTSYTAQITTSQTQSASTLRLR